MFATWHWSSRHDAAKCPPTPKQLLDVPNWSRRGKSLTQGPGQTEIDKHPESGVLTTWVAFFNPADLTHALKSGTFQTASHLERSPFWPPSYCHAKVFANQLWPHPSLIRAAPCQGCLGQGVSKQRNPMGGPLVTSRRNGKPRETPSWVTCSGSWEQKTTLASCRIEGKR